MNDSTFSGLNKKSFKMELERNIRSVAIQTSNPANKSTPIENQSQGIATLLVMLAVLTIIVLFCCFSAPGIRGLCKKYIFRTCPYDDPEVDNASTTISDRTSPTIILLPYGRMLVVDHNLFHQLQVDQSGLDLLELSTNLINFNRNNNNRERISESTPSISIFSDNSSMDINKGVSPTVSLGFDSPPLYDEIIRNLTDLPPSYSEVSLMLKTQSSSQKKEVCVEMEEKINYFPRLELRDSNSSEFENGV